MAKVRSFFKHKLGFALILSVIFCAIQIPLVLRHELTLTEAQFYQQFFAPLNISYAVARFIPLVSTTVIVFLLTWLLTIHRFSKVCLAFSSLFFYFNSVLLGGFRLVPLGRELSFSNPADFFTAVNTTFYHTFLPVAQLCLIPIIIYLLDLIFHFKFLRKLELIKWAKQHKISGLVVFLIPIALTIPNAVIAGVDDFQHRYDDRSALTEVAEQFNGLPADSAIIISEDMHDFATVYTPLLKNGQHFQELSRDTAIKDLTNLTDEENVYILLYPGLCYANKDVEPMSNWEYLGLVRQLDTERAYDFFMIQN